MTPGHCGRFAPSPTGPLHAGSLLTALGSWLMARSAGGDWLVRIEDVDVQREVPGAADAQLRTLAAFGLVPDGSVLRQSTRSDAYAEAIDGLLASGEAFHCHCSRSDLHATQGRHRRCVAGASRADPSVRLRVPDGTTVAFDDALRGRIVQDVAREVGDVVLKRADGGFAYQLAVVVDDAAQGITHVVRGGDLLDSTPRQLLLQRALGLPTPRYAHLPLIVDDDGRKLSKSLASMRIDDVDPLPALRATWRLLGQEASVVASCGSVDALLAAALAAFAVDRIPRAPWLPLAASHNGVVASGE